MFPAVPVAQTRVVSPTPASAARISQKLWRRPASRPVQTGPGRVDHAGRHPGRSRRQSQGRLPRGLRSHRSRPPCGHGQQGSRYRRRSDHVAPGRGQAVWSAPRPGVRSAQRPGAPTRRDPRDSRNGSGRTERPPGGRCRSYALSRGARRGALRHLRAARRRRHPAQAGNDGLSRRGLDHRLPDPADHRLGRHDGDHQ